MTSAGIIGAAVGCGSALLIILGFIIFRHKKNEASCWNWKFLSRKSDLGNRRVKSGVTKSPTGSGSSVSGTFSSISKNGLGHLKASPIQPEPSSINSGVLGESFYPSQTLFPLDYQRKLSSATGYSSYSNDTARWGNESYMPSIVKLHYRIYYDLDNAQLILHILEAQFTTSNSQPDSSPDRQRQLPYRDTFVTISLSASDGELRNGQTKTARIGLSGSANYNEIFALPANFETLKEQLMRFDVLYYNSYSRPLSLGTVDVDLGSNPLDNRDLWIELNMVSSSSLSSATDLIRRDDAAGKLRPEVLVFLSYYMTKDELQVDILKAKNLVGLFPDQSHVEIDLYVKTCLIIDGAKFKRRTNLREFAPSTNPTAVWNESIIFPVKFLQLETCVLLLYLVLRWESKKEKVIGKCTIGPFGSTSNGGCVQWQQQGSNAQILRSTAAWHSLIKYRGRKDSG